MHKLNCVRIGLMYELLKNLCIWCYGLCCAKLRFNWKSRVKPVKINIWNVLLNVADCVELFKSNEFLLFLSVFPLFCPLSLLLDCQRTKKLLLNFVRLSVNIFFVFVLIFACFLFPLDATNAQLCTIWCNSIDLVCYIHYGELYSVWA